MRVIRERTPADQGKTAHEYGEPIFQHTRPPCSHFCMPRFRWRGAECDTRCGRILTILLRNRGRLRAAPETPPNYMLHTPIQVDGWRRAWVWRQVLDSSSNVPKAAGVERRNPHGTGSTFRGPSWEAQAG